MGHCFDCANWIIGKKTVYGDGSEIFTQTSNVGRGRCQALNIETTPEFGCNAYSLGEVHVVIMRKDGAPWENFEYRPCPDCGGRGSTPGAGMCERCYGTSRVRYYDDGYIGEERTRLHPKETEPPCTEQPTMVTERPNPFVAQDTLPIFGNGMTDSQSPD